MVSDPIFIEPWGIEGLTRTLRSLFGNADGSGTASATVRYDYQIAAEDPSIRNAIPVLATPVGPFGPPQAQALLDSMAQWYAAFQPNPTDGHWDIRLTTFADQGDALRPQINVWLRGASAP